jgi:hypothetical protein
MHDMDTTTTSKKEEEEGKPRVKKQRMNVDASVTHQFGHPNRCV